MSSRLSPHSTFRQSPRSAAEAGLYDQSHLNRLFKRTYGVTPGTYAGLHPRG
ncbi:AraC family transcriptional regulator [Trinickia terrae]|uniref:AraC family transcriptional regulator n=1 Tax=Trinickia terrae TaxID=2571161 RepID=UPI00197F47FB|nr:AraC family transcriptional regulator [Trinickia terrae]